MWASPALAQKGGRGGRVDPSEFRHKLERFIIDEAGISPDEAAKFFPVFHEMKDKQMEIGKQIMRLKKKKDPAQMTEKECTEIVLKVESLKVEQAKVGESYTKKMCKTISSKKVFKALKAEDHFHRMMLRDFPKKRE